MNGKPVSLNQNLVDSIVNGGKLAITKESLLEQVNAYAQDLLLLQNGARYSDLGISERRAETKSSIKSDSHVEQETFSYALHRISGVMRLEDTISHYGMRRVANQMYQMDENPEVAFHLIDFNSGGGYSTAGQYMLNVMRDMEKPTIAFVHRAGSAAYMTAMAADHIMMAGNLADAGSIGVYTSVSKTMIEWYKANYEDIYSTHSPEKNEDFRKMLNGDTSKLLEQVTESDIIFMDEVKASRSNVEDSALKGGMYKGKEALKMGLADSIGSLKDAIHKGWQLSQTNNQSDDMDFKGIISALNSKFFKGNEIKEDATQEEVAEAIGNLELSDSKAESLMAEIQKGNKATEDKIANLEASIEKQGKEVADLKGKVGDLETQLKASEDAAKAAAKAAAGKETQEAAMGNPPANLEEKTEDGVTTVIFTKPE